MPGLVKCDVCEKVFNSRYLASHMRMAHRVKERKTPKMKPQEAMRNIVALYRELSTHNRQKVLERLSALEE